MIGAGATACVVTLAATPLVIAYLRRLSVLDVANDRTLHTVPTPRGGGAAVVLGLFAGVLYTLLASDGRGGVDVLPMTLAITLFGLLGLAEDVTGDLGGISPLRRLVLQGIASAAITALAILDGRPGIALLVAAVILGPIWLTGFVNAFNFMDGANGVSAAQATVAGLGYTLVGTLHHSPALVAGGITVAGAALGFAPFNLPRALVFLGDVGSYAFGGAIAALALQAALSGVRVEAVVAPVALYLADTATTLLRRIRGGERWYLPHRGHAYQRLVTAGWSHTAVAGYNGALAALCAALGLAAAGGAGVPVRVAADLLTCLVVVHYLGAPRRAAGRIARRGAVGPTGNLAGPQPVPRPEQAAARALPAVPAQREPADDRAATQPAR
jgi:UDP-N-acetylmuramyl pentapeptide phosphotransferase/UDP-N-acetylglucosamine-1-phosphate transferase